MKKLKGSLLAKTVAIILLTATVLAFAVSAKANQQAGNYS